MLRTTLLLIASTTLSTSLPSLDRIDNHRELTLYQNPCTGSWSNDVKSMKDTDCSMETGAIARVDEPSNPEIMDCSIKSPMNPSALQKMNRLEFWYAVEVTEEETESWLNLLADKIYDVAFERMSFCIASGKRRQRRSLLSTRRKLGILSVSSNPPDKHRSDVACPAALDIGTNEFCYVIQGRLSLLARATDDVTYTFGSMIDAIKDATAPNTLLLGADISTVTNVTFLGTTQSDAENWIPPAVILPPGQENNPIGFLPVDSKKSGAVISVVTIGAIALLALLLFFLWKRQRDDNERDLLWAASDDESNIDGFKNLIGTGDSPGSFHYGKYHYFIPQQHGPETDNWMDGQPVPGDTHQPYLSTNCKDCHDTRLSFLDGSRNLVLANSKELGAGHSGVNVHKCSSSTCKVCQAGFRNTGAVGFERLDPNQVECNVIVPMEDINEDLRIVQTLSSNSSKAYGSDTIPQRRQSSPPGIHFSQNSTASSTSEEDTASEVVQSINEDSTVPQIV